MSLKSINPYTLETNFETNIMTLEQIGEKINKAHEAYASWKKKTIKERTDIIRNLAALMAADVD